MAPERSRRRIWLRLLIALAAGGAACIGVTWLIAVYAQTKGLRWTADVPEVGDRSKDPMDWNRAVWTMPDGRLVSGSRADALGSTQLQARPWAGPTHGPAAVIPVAAPSGATTFDGYEWCSTEVLRFGWPCRCAAAITHVSEPSSVSTPAPITRRPTFPGLTWSYKYTTSGQLYLRDPDLVKPSPGLYLPTKPIWTGVVVNTLFFALVALAAHGLFMALRRAQRRRRGVCLRCAYPLTGLARCPECGEGAGTHAPPGPTASAR